MTGTCPSYKPSFLKATPTLGSPIDSQQTWSLLRTFLRVRSRRRAAGFVVREAGAGRRIAKARVEQLLAAEQMRETWTRGSSVGDQWLLVAIS